MDVHRARLAEVVVPPDLAQQLLAGQHAPGMKCQEREQIEFARRECERAPAVAGLARGRIHAELTDLDPRRLARRPGPAQQGLQARDQLARAERLRQVVVRTVFEAEQLVHFRRAGGEHDRRQVARGRLRTHLAQQFETAAARQHQIHDERIGTGREQAPQAFLAVADGGDAKPGALEVVANEIADLLLVLDHQHQVRHAPSARDATRPARARSTLGGLALPELAEGARPGRSRRPPRFAVVPCASERLDSASLPVTRRATRGGDPARR